ncbi:MAG: hypothetical protein GY906_32120 [bacterium]|nr:hypothetical protein [bacterium]
MMKTNAPRTAQTVHHLFGSVSAICLVFCFGLISVHAATITVTRQSDGTLQELDGNGQCDLREAIEASNTDTVVGECAAGSGKDRIVFDLDYPSFSFILEAPLPDITDPVEIDGSTEQSCGRSHCVEISGIHAGESNGFIIASGNTTLRGLIINRFGLNGIYITGGGNNLIEGNRIGLSDRGSRILPNVHNGIVIHNSSNNTIGGVRDHARNAISGNGVIEDHEDETRGVGIWIDGPEATGNLLIGNHIGAPGFFATPNHGNATTGVLVNGPGNTIGGINQNEGNVISNNGAHGIWITAPENQVLGNMIGVGLDPIDTYRYVRGNHGDGIRITSLPGDLVQGGNTISRNIIAYNHWSGVTVEAWPDAHDGGSARGNHITRNSIYLNYALGIDLLFPRDLGESVPGVTFNDTGDVDIGPNGLQNFPKIISVERAGANLTVKARLKSTPYTQFEIDFYANQHAEANRYGEGERFRGRYSVSTDENGEVEFTRVLFGSAGSDRYVTATATDPNGNTSEFSNAARIDTPSHATITVNSTNDGSLEELGSNGLCDLREAIESANTDTLVGDCKAGRDFDTIIFDIAPGGVQTIRPVTALPIITNPVVIDAITQPKCGNRTCIEIDGSNSGSSDGLTITAGNSTIRGMVVNRFSGSGIVIRGAGGNLLEYNNIGTDTRETEPRSNGDTGILIDNSSNNQIGGTSFRSHNVIAANGYGVAIVGDLAADNLVRGNFIGTNPHSSQSLGNRLAGVLVEGHDNQIGSFRTGRNIISGNGDSEHQAPGVIVKGVDNRIEHNSIGTDVENVSPLGNTDCGIRIHGSEAWISYNTVAFNNAAGVSIEGSAASANYLGVNRCFSNGGLGIDLGNDGITSNDPGDHDSGPNAHQNFPVLERVVRSELGIYITGSLESRPNTTYYISVYSNTGADPSGFGEGEIYVAGTYADTDAAGYVSFGVDRRGEYQKDLYYTATATIWDGGIADPKAGTSEFSRAIQAVSSIDYPNVITVTGTADSHKVDNLAGNGTCDLREAIIAAKYDYSQGECVAGRWKDIIAFDIGDGGHHVITPVTDLPRIDRPVIIDGTTQPGCIGPCIEIIGTSPDSDTGLLLSANDIVVKGLVINDFEYGITVSASSAVITGNYIGTDVTGTHDKGNGIGIEIHASNNVQIGGTQPGDTNLVAFNSEQGISVIDSQQVRMVGNSIFSNGELGIDLYTIQSIHEPPYFEFYELGVTQNDPGDEDEGSNGFQNFPILTAAVLHGDRVVLAGRLESSPNTEFEVDFYANREADPSGYGEGEVYLGQTIVTTDESGEAEFITSFPIRLESAHIVTATAADPDGNTSEFSEAFAVTLQEPLTHERGLRLKTPYRAEPVSNSQQ